MHKLAITQVRSGIGALKRHKATLRTLGLGKINRCVLHDDTPQIRGMARSVRHLVVVEQVGDEVCCSCSAAPETVEESRPVEAVTEAEKTEAAEAVEAAEETAGQEVEAAEQAVEQVEEDKDGDEDEKA